MCIVHINTPLTLRLLGVYMHYTPHKGGITYTYIYFPLKPYFKGNHSAINLIIILHLVHINPFRVWYMHRHLLANLTQTTWQDESNSTNKKAFSSQHNTQKYTILAFFNTFECTSGQLDLTIFRGWSCHILPRAREYISLWCLIYCCTIEVHTEKFSWALCRQVSLNRLLVMI